jgi:predicted phosphohydrolase
VGNQRKPIQRVLVKVTHEPAVPQNWPDGHVSVTLTDSNVDECIEVTIHGVKHFLHSTTARELNNRLTARIDTWNATARAAGFPEV